jgi:hypothetical protein
VLAEATLPGDVLRRVLRVAPKKSLRSNIPGCLGPCWRHAIVCLHSSLCYCRNLCGYRIRSGHGRH